MDCGCQEATGKQGEKVCQITEELDCKTMATGLMNPIVSVRGTRVSVKPKLCHVLDLHLGVGILSELMEIF